MVTATPKLFVLISLMATAPAAGPPRAEVDETILAARVASTYFEHFDKSDLYHAAAHRGSDWLLGDHQEVCDAFGPPAAPLRGLQAPDSHNRYTFLLPHSCAKPLTLQELHQVTRELVVGIYVFNQTPRLSFEANHDGSSTCFLPSAYHDTLLGETLVSVDYFVKSLLHGTTVPEKENRKELNDSWRKTPHDTLRESFAAAGMISMQEDEELGSNLYAERKREFIRYPPNCVDRSLSAAELTSRLTTGEEHDQQENHVSRDVFLRFLDQVSVSLVFRQQQIRQEGPIFVLDPMAEVTTGVIANKEDATDRELYNHLHVYLQKQRQFVADNLYKKRQIAHDLELLGFASFMVSLLVTLKQRKKIVDISQLLPISSKRTDRELPPIFPSQDSRWSPFTTRNTHTGVHGGVMFHHMEQEVRRLPTEELQEIREVLFGNFSSNGTTSSRNASDLATCAVNGQTYYLLSLTIEDYYSKTPKLPRWLHAMFSELKIQSSRLPVVNDARVQDFLRKSLGPRKAAQLKTVNVSLQASIENGVLPAVGALLKRTTKTRLNKVDENGLGVIHYAAIHCRPDVLSLLILAGADVSLPRSTPDQQPTNTQAIHLAARSGGLDTICCLLRYGAKSSVKGEQGWAAIHYAAFHNYQSIVAHLASVDPGCIELETGDKQKATPLLLAARNGGFDTVKALIELGANVKAIDSFSRNIVHIASLHHHINLLKYLVELNTPELPVWEELAEMLTSEPATGYPEASSKSLDPLTQWRPTCCDHLLKQNAIVSLVKLLKQSDEGLQRVAVQVLRNLSNNAGICRALMRAEAIPPLVKLLGSTSDRIHSCTCVVLSDLATDVENQSSIAKAGAIPQLVKLLASESDDVQLFACACLGILTGGNPDNQTSFSETSGIPVIISLLRSPLSCIQACAASALVSILEGHLGNQLKALSENIVPPLVSLLRSKSVAVHSNAARAIEALAQDCEESQRDLFFNSTCISLLKRLLRMRDPTVKVCGGCALWAIAGHLTSNKRVIATHMGLELLVDMLTVHDERLDYVCSEALGALASELGDNQDRIAAVGGVKPLVDILTSRSTPNQRVYLSVIHTLAALTMKPALVPNSKLQTTIAAVRGIHILASIVSSQKAEIVRVEAACTLAKLVLNHTGNDKYLNSKTKFSYLLIFKFFTSEDPIVRLRAGYCLSVMAFNNPAKLELMKHHGRLHVSNFLPFLQSEDEILKVHAAFQVVVLSKLLTGVQDAEAAVNGIKLLVELCSSQSEQTTVLSAEFLACLAHSGGGIPNTVVMAGALDPLIWNLKSENGPVIESSCVALGYLTFNPMASRLIIGTFRDDPELFEIFKDQYSTVVVSKRFQEEWVNTEKAGLPSLR